jgi:hypothetical protein
MDKVGKSDRLVERVPAPSIRRLVNADGNAGTRLATGAVSDSFACQAGGRIGCILEVGDGAVGNLSDHPTLFVGNIGDPQSATFGCPQAEVDDDGSLRSPELLGALFFGNIGVPQSATFGSPQASLRSPKLCSMLGGP